MPVLHHLWLKTENTMCLCENDLQRSPREASRRVMMTSWKNSAATLAGVANGMNWSFVRVWPRLDGFPQGYWKGPKPVGFFLSKLWLQDISRGFYQHEKGCRLLKKLTNLQNYFFFMSKYFSLIWNMWTMSPVGFIQFRASFWNSLMDEPNMGSSNNFGLAKLQQLKTIL